ncbi:extracellular metalloproteinase [Aspergillus fijiensis CBS 313.89]|uniref:Extracellular metalloproteinase n=1 Tax=Aspergillus fijiensis CBS 313.89 TaxID=1448319 RepID=A0A8G1W1U5_9EURO|nr:extracellular metallo proteinase MEP [Aspergillus fijiensis CBS 313.89]RAK80043.1 extracellular metallo proteinase MEP [Aspergillus fijiensis CBS 313.89]
MVAVSLSLCVLALPLQLSNSLNLEAIDPNTLRLTSRASYVNSIDAVADNIRLAARAGQANYLETATRLVETIVPGAAFRMIDDHYIGENDVAHVHFRQTVHDMDIDNADFNVNVGKDGTVFSYGNSFYTGKIPHGNPLLRQGVIDPVTALDRASKALSLALSLDNLKCERVPGTNNHVFQGTSGAITEPKARLVFLLKSDESLALTWRVEAHMDSNWYLTYVDAGANATVHGVVDYASSATYEVYEWGLNDPTEGARTTVTDPWDKTASPFTWQGDGNTIYTTTRGNNGIAQSNPSGLAPYMDNYRPSSPASKFEYAYSPTMSPPDAYVNASITQLLYTANTYHDLLYTLGFTEKAGNFQWNNSGRGGRENDYVILNAQDGLSYNNAYFKAPPDGEPGHMRINIFTHSDPPRDADFDAGMVIHEYTHGLSTRLTGGPANSGCLSAFEAGGMGEGWSDFMATAMRLKPHDTRATDYAFGGWASNASGQGSRLYPYSTSLTTNPLTYASVDGMLMLHDAGSVWASILYEILWNLIDRYGKNDGPKPVFRDKVPTDGRYLAMKLVMDAMALQPCNPTFLQARDAILDADRALTKGANQCAIWKGFAKRGLGQGAKTKGSVRLDSNIVPFGVC